MPKNSQINNFSNAFGERNTDKSNIINLNNDIEPNKLSNSNINVPDFYKMIETEKNRRLVRFRIII